MKTSEFISKFCSKYLWFNITAMIAVVVALVVGVVVAIDCYTNHGESVSIPNLRGHSYENAVMVLESMGLSVEVIDTGYVRSLPAGAVLQQSPEPGKQVKPGRIILLTLNAQSSPTLVLPDVIDNCSYRAAVAKLTSMGFKLAEPEYIAGEKGWVYGVRYRGRNITCGERVDVDSKITLQVGNGMREEGEDVFFTDADLNIGDDDSDVPSFSDDFEIIDE